MVYSIIKKSQLEGAERIDAEYFQPEYLMIENKLKSIKSQPLSAITSKIVNFGAYSLCNYIVWQDEGVPYLNVADIKEGYIDYSNVKYIDEKVNDILSKSQVHEGDLILTMAGTIGNVAIAYNVPEKLNSNQATAKITLKKGNSPFYISAFFNSHFGKQQILREVVSSVQPNIFLWQIQKFEIPMVSEKFQQEIENLYKNFLNELENSQQFLKQAENLLLEELGLKDFKPEEKNFSIVNLSDVQTVNRMDSDFFQPKYDQLINRLKKVKTQKLGNLLKRKTERINILPNESYKYTEISDVNVSNGEVIYNEMLGKELPASAHIPLKGDELIISKVRPTRGAVSSIPKKWNNNFVCSGAFSVFEDNEDLDEYLFIVLRSIVGKLQMERPCTGTSYPTITDQDIENILIPILAQPTKQKIVDLVRKSHSARQKSKELLEKAKRIVEEMIEKGGE